MTLVSLAAPILYPTPPYNDLAHSEGIGETALTMNASGFYVAMIFQSPVTDTLDRVGLQIGAITQAPVNGLSITLEGVTSAGAPNGVVNGNAGTIAITGADVNIWKTTTAGMAASLVTGSWYALTVRFTTFVAGDSLALIMVGGGQRVHNPYVNSNGTKSTGYNPRFSLHSASAVIYVDGVFPHQGATTDTPLDHFRFDPFVYQANTPTAGPNTASTSGVTMSSIAHGLTTTRPFQRVRVFDGAMAGLSRIGIAIPDVDTVTLDEAFPSNLGAGTNWEKVLYAAEGAVKFQIPFPARTQGLWWAGTFNSGGTHDFILYSADGQTIVASNLGSLSGYASLTAIYRAYFTTPVSLSASTTYYLAFGSPTTATNSFGVACMSCATAALLAAFGFRANGVYSERFNIAGASNINDVTAGGQITLAAALTGTNRVVYNSTNPSYSDWVKFTSGVNNGLIRQITGLTSQQVFTVDATGLTADTTDGITWRRLSSWSDRTLSVPMMGIVLDQVDDGAGGGGLRLAGRGGLAA